MTATYSDIAEIADRYSKALFDLAREQKALDAIEKDLLTIENAINTSASFARLLGDPSLSRSAKEHAVSAILQKLGVSDLTQRFFIIVAHNKRLPYTSQINNWFMRKLAAHRGEVRAEIISAEPLAPSQITTIEDSLAKVTGKKVRMKSSVKEKLIAGVRIRIGSTLIDSTINNKLERLRRELKALPVVLQD